MKLNMTALAKGLPTFARDAAGLAGCGLVSYGAWLIYDPAGFIVGGLVLVVGAFMSAKADA
jgi:hypothetical protein